MSLQLVTLPIVPEETARRAKYLYGEGNLYIQLGDQINDLLALMPQVAKDDQAKRGTETTTCFALMTVLQYSEALTDFQIIEAVRNRIDLRYALHLPLDYPHFEPTALCKFRLGFLNCRSDRDTFQALLDKLIESGFLNNCQGPSISVLIVLETICTSTRIERVLDGMHRALETLAATNGDWLRMIALPLWYERYSRNKRISVWPNGNGEWKSRVIEIGTDVNYLLEQIHRSPQPGIKSLREIQNLVQVWEDQYEMTSDDDTPAGNIHWRYRGCSSCIQYQSDLMEEM